MRRTTLVALAIGLLIACGAAAAATTIPAAAVRTAEQLRDRALHDDTAYRIVSSLTTEVGPRLAGSDADLRAREWAVAKFKALGFDKVYTEPVTFPLWQRRGESGAIVAPFPQPLVLTALGSSPATPTARRRRCAWPGRRSPRPRAPPVTCCVRPAPMRASASPTPGSPVSATRRGRFPPRRCPIPTPTSSTACSPTASR